MNQESEALDVSEQIPPNVNWCNVQIYADLHGTRKGKAVIQTAAQALNNSDDNIAFLRLKEGSGKGR